MVTVISQAQPTGVTKMAAPNKMVVSQWFVSYLKQIHRAESSVTNLKLSAEFKNWPATQSAWTGSLKLLQ
jgi:hypothetical protein